MPLNNEASYCHRQKSNHAYKPDRVEINRVGISGFVFAYLARWALEEVKGNPGFFRKFMGIVVSRWYERT